MREGLLFRLFCPPTCVRIPFTFEICSFVRGIDDTFDFIVLKYKQIDLIMKIVKYSDCYPIFIRNTNQSYNGENKLLYKMIIQ